MSENTSGQSERQAIDTFIASWNTGRLEMKTRLIDFVSYLEKIEDVQFQFVARAGVSYSVRPFCPEQRHGRSLFAMIDIIDDEPEQRWLSVCFYGDMISDPEKQGEVIPGGLSGDDGYCFDMFEDDDELAEYIKKRLTEAAEAARK